MSDITDWVTATFTVVLAFATIALAWNTARLAKVSKEVADASERLSIRPALKFEALQSFQDGGNVSVRISLKNIGNGPAKNPVLKAKGLRGQALRVEPHTQGNVMELNVPFYWDIYGVVIDEDVDIEVSFSNLKDEPQLSFKHSFRVR